MLIISGHSDDLIEVEGHLRDEFPAPSGDSGKLKLTGPNGEGCCVTVSYGNEGCWDITVGLLEEDKVIPWPITITGDGYTAKATVDCPDDVTVEPCWELG